MTDYVAMALDQSASNTGWALLPKGGKVTFGSFLLDSWHEKEGERLLDYFEWLCELVERHGITHLFLESKFNTEHNEDISARIADYGMIGVADMAAAYMLRYHKMTVKVITVQPQQWRPPFIGGQKAPGGLTKHFRKKWYIERAIQQCALRGLLIDVGDQAEAVGILSYGVSTIDMDFAVLNGPLFRRAEAAYDEEIRAWNEKAVRK